MQFFDKHIERVVVLVCIAVCDNDIGPEIHVFEGLDDGFVGTLRERVGIETHGAGKQVCVLGKADEAGSDCLARDAVNGKSIDCDGAVRELYHAEEGEYERGFAAEDQVSALYCVDGWGGWDLPSGATDDGHLLACLDREREVLNDWLARSGELVLCNMHSFGVDLPMECSNIVEFNLAATRPSRWRDVVFSVLVLGRWLCSEGLDSCNATDVRLQLRPESDEQLDAL
jgi:hypothetical protein